MDVDRSWRHVWTAAVHNVHDDRLVQAQVAGMIQAVSTESDLPLPEMIRNHIEESILNAIRAYSSNEDEIVPDPSSPVIQVEIHLETQPVPPGLPDGPASRWGFFLVQKPSRRPASAQLFLDLFLYQE